MNKILRRFASFKKIANIEAFEEKYEIKDKNELSVFASYKIYDTELDNPELKEVEEEIMFDIEFSEDEVNKLADKIKKEYVSYQGIPKEDVCDFYISNGELKSKCGMFLNKRGYYTYEYIKKEVPQYTEETKYNIMINGIVVDNEKDLQMMGF
jgi:hypothetical protein